MKTTREFVATVFVVKDGKTLLVWHKKLQMWLPPGGHIEEGELPDDCAIREAEEETGLKVELIGSTAREYNNGRVRTLATPNHVQLEDIAPGHQHIDLVYIAKAVGGLENLNHNEAEKMRWFSSEELGDKAITDNIRHYGRIAITKLREVE